MDFHCESLLNDFIQNKASYEELKTVALSKLADIVKNEGLVVTGIEGRVKTENSLKGKLELKGNKYKTIDDVTDLVGTRIITFYSDDVDKIASAVGNVFEVDWENSVDKRKEYTPDRFGYMSLHYICKIPKTLYYNENNPKINEIRFEVQIKTALQHVWATINHDMGYKTDVDIPVDYARKLLRLAGLLELADEEFKNFRLDILKYRRRILTLLHDGNYADIKLDADSFGEYLNTEPFGALTEKIAEINKADIQQASATQYLHILSNLGLKTLQDVENLKKDYSDDAYRLAVSQMSGKDIDIVTSTIGIQNVCIVYIIKKGYGEIGLKYFFDELYGKRDRNLASAKRIIEQATKINIIGEERE